MAPDGPYNGVVIFYDPSGFMVLEIKKNWSRENLSGRKPSLFLYQDLDLYRDLNTLIYCQIIGSKCRNIMKRTVYECSMQFLVIVKIFPKTFK